MSRAWTQAELSIEVWKDVLGNEGIHEVSNLGRFRKTTGSASWPAGIREGHLGPHGVSVSLRKGGRSKLMLLHVLVMAAFGPPKPHPTWVIRFLDDNKANCRIENLKWEMPRGRGGWLTADERRERRLRQFREAMRNQRERKYKARGFRRSTVRRTCVMVNKLVRSLKVFGPKTPRSRLPPEEVKRRKALHRKADKHRRRAMGKSNGSGGDRKVYRAFVLQVRTARRMKCYWCQSPVPIGERHLDHIVPLNKGGPDEVHNLCCACFTCNTTKRDKMPEQFCGQGQLAFV